MSLKSFQFQLANLRPWLTLFVVVWLLGSLGLGWLVNSLLILVGLIFLVPIIGFFGFRWWLQQNLVTDKCPACGFELPGFKNRELQCPNCGEVLSVQDGHFQRVAPEGTIDVKAVEIPTNVLEE
ncbi:hypothetical protein [Calothrix sp. UHCC 0171]|uniref:hypothetical protein n=1 Tax=Calothrix sp. UHCC 0171 TaxID=3110245 RepID=UPI002B21B1FA|nr:hypothetical protein [Calothrix sp. UHCC 0171]MEA5569803.1 hypothetical protein [Calothrix sp. UHCC 0171]